LSGEEDLEGVLMPDGQVVQLYGDRFANEEAWHTAMLKEAAKEQAGKREAPEKVD
jgi:hypothetical protein